MDSMKVAVMGGGNGSHTIAADLTLKGLSVNMFELERFAAGMRQVFETREIEVEADRPLPAHYDGERFLPPQEHFKVSLHPRAQAIIGNWNADTRPVTAVSKEN